MKITQNLSQKKRLQSYFENGGKITSRDAMIYHGIGRLASRVCELRQSGMPIDSHTVKSTSGKRVTVYYLKAEKKAA